MVRLHPVLKYLQYFSQIIKVILTLTIQITTHKKSGMLFMNFQIEIM